MGRYKDLKARVYELENEVEKLKDWFGNPNYYLRYSNFEDWVKSQGAGWLARDFNALLDHLGLEVVTVAEHKEVHAKPRKSPPKVKDKEG